MSLSMISFFFISTPFPWAVILSLILYRHDLSQLVHPLKDRSSMRDWRSVLHDLDISDKTSSQSSDNRGKWRSSSSKIECLQADILEEHRDIRYYTTTIIIVSFASLVSSFVLVPFLIEASSFLLTRFDLIISASLQLASAVPSVFAMELYFGPFPSPPNKYHLRKRRLGSLVRYDRTLNQNHLKHFQGTYPAIPIVNLRG
jgi:hypothetical protein